MKVDGSGQTSIQSDAFLPVWTPKTPTTRSASLAATGVKRMVSARTAARFAMPLPAFTTMQSVKLGAGAWTVIGKATAVDSGPVDIARCRLVDGSTALDGAAVQVSGSHRAETLTNVATVVVPAGTTARLLQQCGHDQSNGESVSIDPDASLVAFQTRDGTAAGQSIVRTTAQTPLPAAGAIVLSQALPPGNYAAGFKVTAVSFSGPAVVDCRLTFAGPSGAAIAMVGSATDVVTRSFFTYLTGGGTVSLFCTGSDTSSVYLDPDAVLWVRQAKSFTAVYGGCGASLVNGTTDLVAMLRIFDQCNIQTTPNLSSASITKGSWVALGGESRLINDAASGDFVRCTLSTDVTHLDGSSEWVDASMYTGVTVLGAVKTTSTVTLIEGCASDANGLGRSFVGSLVLIRI
jgi:hypothetical protein